MTKEITASTEQFLFTLEQMYLAGVMDEQASEEEEVLTPEYLRERIVSHLKDITANSEKSNEVEEEISDESTSEEE